MKVPEAKEYLAVLIDSAGRVLMRSKPGSTGGHFIRAEPSGNKSPGGSLIDTVFDESGLKVKVVSVGVDVYFGGSGACGYFIVELVDSEGVIRSDDFLVNWYGIEEASCLISNIKNDTDFELEMAVLGVAASIIEESVVLVEDRLKSLVGTAELEDFKRLCHLIERILSGGGGGCLGLGMNSALVVGFLDETKKRIDLGEVNSEYVHNLISKIGKRVRSKSHENYLVEVIKIFAAQAYSFLVDGDLTGYKEAHWLALEYLKKHGELYPEEGWARRERGFEGGKGRARKTEERGRREEVIRQTIMDVLRKNSPYHARRGPRFIVEKVLDEVLAGLQQQGVESDRKDIDGCIMNLLTSDRVAKKIVGGL